MKIWLISDTHTKHAELRVPQADVVVHCGDEANQRKAWVNKLESHSFFKWYANLPIETKIFVPGNHSVAVCEGLIKPEDFPSVRFLIHELMEFQGLKLFGTPYTPAFFNWVYMKMREELDPVWATIPVGLDLLITHGPPKGIMDVTRDFRTKEPIPIGSKSLTRHVQQRILPRVHAFGHVHDEQGITNFGSETHGETQFINCSCCNLKGQLVNHGIVIEMDAIPIAS